VVDRDFPWSLGSAFGWSPRQDLGRAVREVAARHPGRAEFEIPDSGYRPDCCKNIL
jgi:hypothetical protein